MIRDEEILAVYNQGPNAIVALVKALAFQVNALTERVKQLENQINTNSRNSGKPPSSDGLKKANNLRTKSGKKSGAQKGHPGHALELTDHPDKVVVHEVTECRCGACLADQPPESFERRQMVDLPPLKSEVTEHRAEQKTCHICGAVCKAVFPDDVNQPMQYGPQIRSLASYLNQYQLLPYNRVGEFFKDLFGQSFSEGSLFTANQDIYEALAGYEQDVRQMLLNEPVLNCDETGIRVEGKNHWLHVASTPKLTSYGVYQKRGSNAMDEMGILPAYTGISKHDCLAAYFKYVGCSHSLCNAHHLRELIWVVDNEHQVWVQQMIDLLIEAKAAVDEARDSQKTYLEPQQLAGHVTLQRYHRPRA